jgi:hypothetical protein
MGGEWLIFATCISLALTFAPDVEPPPIAEDPIPTAMIYVLSAKERMCFFEQFPQGVDVHFAFEVIGGQNLMDINLQLMSPSDGFIANVNKESHHTVKFIPETTGDYKICLDNSFSSLSYKIVYFEYFTIREYERLVALNGSVDYIAPTLMDSKISDLIDSVDKVRDKNTQAIRSQSIIRSLEFKDRKMAERNYNLVNRMSIAGCFFIILTGAIQILFIRSLFADRGGKGLKVGL